MHEAPARPMLHADRLFQPVTGFIGAILLLHHRGPSPQIFLRIIFLSLNFLAQTCIVIECITAGGKRKSVIPGSKAVPAPCFDWWILMIPSS